MIAAVIPTLNEARHIGPLLDQLLANAPPDLAEIWVADGGSADGTREIVVARSQLDARVRMLDNPDRIQASGINLAAAAADPAVSTLIRIDAHSGYPANYIADLQSILVATNADSVVVRLRTQGRECFQKAVAAVSNSALGAGGAAHRIGGASRWIDHGHHAAFRRESFTALGGYDRNFHANEDAEFDFRLRQAGGRIWFASEVEVDYYPRSSPLRLARQYFRYGKGRAQNLMKNGERLHLRQLAPPILVIAILLALACAPLVAWTLVLPLAYLGATAFAGLALAIRGRDGCLLAAGCALPCMHLSWGVGFLVMLVVKVIFRTTSLDREMSVSKVQTTLSAPGPRRDVYGSSRNPASRPDQNTVDWLE